MRKLVLLAATVMSISVPMIAQSGIASADDWGVRFTYGSGPSGWNGYNRPYDGPRNDGILSRHAIRRIASAAHNDVHDIELHGRTYVMHARNDDGRPVVMALDACSGALLAIHYTDGYGNDWGDRQQAWNDDNDRDWNRPPPPPPPQDDDHRGW